MITAFHGIGAYRGQRNPVSLSRALSTALSGVELCVADRPIGAFGAVFFGELTALFSQDVWSSIDDNGNRIVTADFSDVFITHSCDSQSEFNAHCANAIAADDSYCEGWMRPVALRAIWVKDWSDADTVKAARIIAKNRGVPLLVVNGKDRIWDLYEKLPTRVYSCA